MTRRDFSSLTAATAFAATQRPIRVAMIGTGHGHAQSKAKALGSMPEYELAGVLRYKNEPALPNVPEITLDQILKDSSIELVAVETADFSQNLVFAQQCINAN